MVAFLLIPLIHVCVSKSMQEGFEYTVSATSGFALLTLKLQMCEVVLTICKC